MATNNLCQNTYESKALLGAFDPLCRRSLSTRPARGAETPKNVIGNAGVSASRVDTDRQTPLRYS